MSAKIAEIRERLAKATPWPWHREDVGQFFDPESILSIHGPDNHGYPHILVTDGYRQGGTDVANADFIAHAPTDIAFLLAEIDRLRDDRDCEKQIRKDAEERREDLIEEVDALRAKLHPWYGDCDALADGGVCSECKRVAEDGTAVFTENASLKAALELGQLNCDAAYDEIRTEQRNARAEVARLKAELEAK